LKNILQHSHHNQPETSSTHSKNNFYKLFHFIKMKSAIATSLLFVATAIAVPLEARTAATVGFALSNDQSGAYSGVTFPADGADRTIPSLFGSASVGSSGHVLASSAQLTQFPGTISCTLKNNGAVLATFTSQKTYAALGGNPAKAIVVNLDHGVINCRA
jgi:hypothetical protein